MHWQIPWIHSVTLTGTWIIATFITLNSTMYGSKIPSALFWLMTSQLHRWKEAKKGTIRKFVLMKLSAGRFCSAWRRSVWLSPEALDVEPGDKAGQPSLKYFPHRKCSQGTNLRHQFLSVLSLYLGNQLFSNFIAFLHLAPDPQQSTHISLKCTSEI